MRSDLRDKEALRLRDVCVVVVMGGESELQRWREEAELNEREEWGYTVLKTKGTGGMPGALIIIGGKNQSQI